MEGFSSSLILVFTGFFLTLSNTAVNNSLHFDTPPDLDLVRGPLLGELLLSGAEEAALLGPDRDVVGLGAGTSKASL